MLVVAAALWILMQGADLLVDGAAGMAYRWGIPKVIVGATVVSLGTTSPEAAVSVMAAWEGKPGLALGNAVGSIVADTGLIFGLGCLLVVLPADAFVLRRQGWMKIATGFLLIVICYGAWIAQPDYPRIGQPIGFMLLALLFGYLYLSVRWTRGHRELASPLTTADPSASGDEHDDTDSLVDHPNSASKSVWYLLLIAILGLFMVVFASRFLIASVTVLAVKWGISQVVIAATLVALGTSLPELVVGMTAIYRGHREILVGNIIGADILNVLFVIGASAAATSLPVIDAEARFPAIFLMLHLPAMMIMMVLFLIYIFMAVRRGHFARWNGVPLLALYVLYVVLLLALGQTKS